MATSDFLVILRARWVSALVVFLVVVASTVAGSLLLPKSYTATASLLVDMKPDPVAGIFIPHNVTGSSYMATQADLLTSERVARKAIASLGLEQNKELREEWMADTKGATDFAAWLAVQLAKKLDVRPARDSSVLQVAYTSQNPQFSAAVANAYVKGYMGTLLDLKTEPARNMNTYFDDRAKKFRADLELAQNRLSDFQRSKGIVAADERLDVENMRLSEISSQVVAMEAAAAEATSRMGQAGTSPDRMQEVLNNPVVAGLQADLSRQEARLEELRSRLGEANPQVIEARTAIEGLRSKVQSAVQRASGSVSVTSNVAQQRLAQLRAARDEQRAKVLKLKSSRDEIGVLQRDVENAQKAYDAVTARANQSGLESMVTQTNVSIVKEATAPIQPSSPNLLINTALALFVGLLLAAGTVLLRELADPRLRTAKDVTQGLKLPMLVVMPRPRDIRRGAGEEVAHQRLSGSRTPALAAR